MSFGGRSRREVEAFEYGYPLDSGPSLPWLLSNNAHAQAFEPNFNQTQLPGRDSGFQYPYLNELDRNCNEA